MNPAAQLFKWISLFAVLMCFMAITPVVFAQSSTVETVSAPDGSDLRLEEEESGEQEPGGPLDLEEPATVLSRAMEALPGFEDGVSGGISVMILLTVITLAPSIVVLCTCFTRIVIVLSLLRQALGTQALPPSQVIVGLSLFLTILVMGPTLKKINNDAIIPLNNEEINDVEAWNIAAGHLKMFMLAQIDYNDNWGDLIMLENYRGELDMTKFDEIQPQDLSMTTVVPAFVLSELKVAFMMGFRVYLPFLIIDMVIASVLISMGMLMLPPVLISLPFKLLLFVMVDGWRLVVGNLLMSFTQEWSPT